MACLLDGHDDQHLVFTGLQDIGQNLAGLAAAVHFSVNSQRTVIKLAGPLQVRVVSHGKAETSSCFCCKFLLDHVFAAKPIETP